LSPAKSKFLSYSLPNSAASSPRFPPVSNLLKRNKKWVRHESRAHTPPRLDFDHLVTLSPYLAMQQEMRSFRRSKSCGEGRAIPPSVDFDLLATQAKATGTAISPCDSSCTSDSSESECRQDVDLKKSNFPGTASDEERDGKGEKESRQGEFKCGALCLFLPGFGKAKPVKSKKGSLRAAENTFVISRTVSLEKFECGSWASPAINASEIIGHEDGAGSGIGDSAHHLYFDLPLEMIRSGANDTHSPVTAAFIFDRERKVVLKKSSSARKSPHGSSRHVRFSTSSPGSHPASPTSCITPRLRKAREDFNAFLDAQSA
ncbi:uncharacterized protein J3R85_001376, partial [Psidium guajava]